MNIIEYSKKSNVWRALYYPIIPLQGKVEKFPMRKGDRINYFLRGWPEHSGEGLRHPLDTVPVRKRYRFEVEIFGSTFSCPFSRKLLSQ